MCPLEGLYKLKGAVGPPYITSRHKRNHSNKGHNHSHHHHDMGHKRYSFLLIKIFNFLSFSLKFQKKKPRHATLSFRNSEDFDHGQWRMQTRGIPSRSRRDAKAIVLTNGKTHSSSSITVQLSSTVSRQKRNNEQIKRIATNDATVERTKRDAPGCITNYNAQRQLLVGCTQPNVIEVRPQCNEDGDEGNI